MVWECDEQAVIFIYLYENYIGGKGGAKRSVRKTDRRKENMTDRNGKWDMYFKWRLNKQGNNDIPLEITPIRVPRRVHQNCKQIKYCNDK